MTDDEEYARGFTLAGEAIDYFNETGDGRPVEMICDLLDHLVEKDTMLPLHHGMAAALDAKKGKPN